VYQANTIWSAPLLKFDKTIKTLNGTPNDALEGMFNSAFNLYLEVYPGDFDHANTEAPAHPWDAGLTPKAGQVKSVVLLVV
jgi:hypothetical protein